MQTFELNVADCRPHPLLERMAMEERTIAYLAESRDPQDRQEAAARSATYEALKASVAEQGVLEPIRVVRTEDGKGWLIVAGRHRWMAAKEAGIFLIPALEMTEDTVANFIQSDTAHRRNMSKGAVAWLLVLLHPEVAGFKVGRPGNSHSVGVSKTPTDNSHSVGISRADLAKQGGVSPSLLDYACELYRLTVKSKSRDKVDAAIAAGRGLGRLIAGLKGEESLPKAEDGKATRPDPGLKGYLRSMRTFSTQLKSAGQWPEEQRETAITETAELFRANPEAARLFTEALAAAASEAAAPSADSTPA